MLDDLRKATNEPDFDFEDDDGDDFLVDDRRKSDTLFLGMTAVERMFLSFFFFMNVAVLGLAFLLATGRIQF
jgi:hypothetical protein